MTHKHTAGPWYVDKGCGLYGCVYGGGLDAPNKLVANCEPEIHKETHTMNEIRANAHFIAAAPEMLDALKGIESTFVFLDSLTAGWEPQHTNTVKALAAVRAAIAKAEGV